MTILFISCNRKHIRPEEKIININENINEKVNEIIFDQVNQYKIDSLLIIDEDTLITGAWISGYFAKNNFIPAWTNADSLLPIADSLLEFAAATQFHGIQSKNYNPQNIIDKLDLITNKIYHKVNVTRIYEVNILLTDLFFRLAVNLKEGMFDEESLLPVWKGANQDTSYVNLLLLAMQKGSIKYTLESIEPKSEQYSLLKINLKKILVNKELFNESAADSLKLMINHIMVNIERIRWEADSNEDYKIFINIPSNTLSYYECEELKLESKIITGKPETPSPFRLDSKIEYFYVYPYWIIPFSIATKEMLPIISKDTNYLVKNNIEILNKEGKIVYANKIKWNKYSEKYFPFTLRQRDGDENTLGVLKFIFKNKYGIYLHDTNSRYLFNKEDRWLSHGCIRLEKAKELAEYICGCCTINFNTDSLYRNIIQKSRKRAELFRPLPVHIRYYTIKADSNNLQFYNDPYLIDEKMITAFNDKLILKKL